MSVQKYGEMTITKCQFRTCSRMWWNTVEWKEI